MSQSKLIPLRAAAGELGVHYMTAYRYVRTGRLAAEQHNGQWFITAKDLAEFATSRSQNKPRPGRPPAGSARVTSRQLSPRRAVALSDRLVAGDLGGSWSILDEALAAGGTAGEINASLITPALSRIGDRWAAGEVTIGQEHLATSVAHRLITRFGEQLASPGRTRGTVLLSAVPGERHALPTAIVSDLLRAEGIGVVDLGADTPGADIARMAGRQDRLLGVGLCATNTLERGAATELRALVQLIRTSGDCPVLLGGRAVTDGLVDRACPDAHSTDADEAVSWFAGLK